MKNIVVILPMRSGSQRVINKNSRIIKGKYLYEFIIDKLLSLLKNNNRIDNNPKLFEISKKELCDVDEEANLLILEKLLAF